VNLQYQGIAVTMLLTSLSQSATAAADLQYDLQEQRRQGMFDQMVMDARICMHDAARTQLQLGYRDSAMILKNVETLCTMVLMRNRKMFAPDVAEENLKLMLRGFAIKELGSVPGLSQIPIPAPSPVLPFRPQINWDQQQVTLRGTLRKGSYEECCFEGKARQSDYYYLALKEKIDIVAKNKYELPLPDLDSIQVGGKTDAIKEGQSVTVICKEIRYGNTGHYARSAYCADPKIKQSIGNK
jgi:hypothetical protein